MMNFIIVRALGILCGWSGHLEVSHCTFVWRLHHQLSNACSRHIFSHVLTSLTNCFQEYKQRTLYGAHLVTLAMLLHLINCCCYYYYYYYYYWFFYTGSMSMSMSNWGWFSMSPSEQRPQTGPFAIPRIYP